MHSVRGEHDRDKFPTVVTKLIEIESVTAEALEAAGKTAKFKIYPNASHGFHADYRPSYSEEAAQDAWQQMIAWFRTYKVLD